MYTQARIKMKKTKLRYSFENLQLISQLFICHNNKIKIFSGFTIHSAPNFKMFHCMLEKVMHRDIQYMSNPGIHMQLANFLPCWTV